MLNVGGYMGLAKKIFIMIVPACAVYVALIYVVSSIMGDVSHETSERLNNYLGLYGLFILGLIIVALIIFCDKLYHMFYPKKWLTRGKNASFFMPHLLLAKELLSLLL